MNKSPAGSKSCSTFDCFAIRSTCVPLLFDWSENPSKLRNILPFLDEWETANFGKTFRSSLWKCKHKQRTSLCGIAHAVILKFKTISSTLNRSIRDVNTEQLNNQIAEWLKIQTGRPSQTPNINDEGKNMIRTNKLMRQADFVLFISVRLIIELQIFVRVSFIWKNK